MNLDSPTVEQSPSGVPVDWTRAAAGFYAIGWGVVFLCLGIFAPLFPLLLPPELGPRVDFGFLIIMLVARGLFLVGFTLCVVNPDLSTRRTWIVVSASVAVVSALFHHFCLQLLQFMFDQGFKNLAVACLNSVAYISLLLDALAMGAFLMWVILVAKAVNASKQVKHATSLLTTGSVIVALLGLALIGVLSVSGGDAADRPPPTFVLMILPGLGFGLLFWSISYACLMFGMRRKLNAALADSHSKGRILDFSGIVDAQR